MALAAASESSAYISLPQAYIAPLESATDGAAAKLASDLRREGLRVELGDQSFRLKKSFENAEKLGVSRVVIIGEDELASNEVAVKDLTTGQQEKVSPSKLAARLRWLDVEERKTKLGKLHELLLKAIREKRLIQFNYQRKVRIAEPHDYGIQNGSVRLLSYQVGGASNSGRLPAWRWIEVPEISELQLLSQTFPGSRSAASSNHHAWDEVFARVDA
jgi:hypothetical protein